MNDSAPLVLPSIDYAVVIAVGFAVIIAGLLGIAPRRAAINSRRRPRPSRAGVLRGWAWLRGMTRRVRSSKGAGADDLRGSAGALLHQYAALLQSGRSPVQAWADLSAHWRSREKSHPLAQICAQAVSAEQAGLGAVVGLQRSLSSITQGHRSQVGPLFLNASTSHLGSPSGSPATGRAGAVAEERSAPASAQTPPWSSSRCCSV